MPTLSNLDEAGLNANSMRPAALTLCLMACGPLESTRSDAVFARFDAILGGQPDAQTRSVFFVIATFNNGQQGFCTGTLVSPRVILTAAHCVDPARENAQSVMVRVMNEPNDTMLMMRDLRNVVQVRRHPNYAGQGPNDLALLQLETAVTDVVPEPLVRMPPPQWTGQTVRVVGYGRTSASGQSDTGTRRAVSTSITRAMAESLEFGQAGTLGICAGDSGGPSFWRDSDGRERIAGVHSYGTTNQCGVGGDVRVDAELSFIDQALNQLDPPACSADGRCQTSGCPQRDPDCTCVADGQCAVCPSGALDPDCPDACAMDGVCQRTGCPMPDADCLADGDVCAMASECAGDRCLADPRGFQFCSRPCADDSVCTREMVCRDGACRALPPTTPKSKETIRGGCKTAETDVSVWSLLALFLFLHKNAARRHELGE
jgi:V8-like Glu-specific endopeptidase